VEAALRGLLALILATSSATLAFARGADSDEPPKPTEAVLVLAMDVPISSGGFRLRRVDLSVPAFAKDGVSFEYDGLFASGSRKALRASDRSPVYFLVRTIPTGTYVATYQHFNDTNVVSHIKTWRCTSEQAAVIEVIAGKVNVVRSNDIFPPGILGRLNSNISNAIVLSSLEAVAVEHPNLAGVPALLFPTATVNWRTKSRHSSLEGCENGEQLRILRKVPPPK
jgi:hypothetical protein